MKKGKFGEGRKKLGVEQERSQEDQKNKAAVEAILLTTEAYPEGLNITERVEIVTAESAFKTNIFEDLLSGAQVYPGDTSSREDGLRSFGMFSIDGRRRTVENRSEIVQKTLRDARRTALYELKREAHEAGANAVVAVDLDYVELNTSGSMVLLVASGTAVRVED